MGEVNYTTVWQNEAEIPKNGFFGTYSPIVLPARSTVQHPMSLPRNEYKAKVTVSLHEYLSVSVTIWGVKVKHDGRLREQLCMD